MRKLLTVVLFAGVLSACAAPANVPMGKQDYIAAEKSALFRVGKTKCNYPYDDDKAVRSIMFTTGLSNTVGASPAFAAAVENEMLKLADTPCDVILEKTRNWLQ